MNENARRGRYGRYVGNLFTLSDFLIINAIYAIVVLINPEAWYGNVRLVGLLFNVAFLPASVFYKELRSMRYVAMDRLILSSLVVILVHALFFFSLLFFLNIEIQGWRAFAELYIGMFIALPIWWAATRLALKAYRRRGRNYITVLIIGTGKNACRLYEEMKFDSGYGYRIAGFVDYGFAPDFPYPELYAGRMQELDRIVDKLAVDQIYYALPGEDEEAMRTTISVADKHMVPFFFVPRLSKYISRAFEMTTIGAVPVLTTRKNPLRSSVNSIMKRTFDVIFSGTLLLLSPIVYIPVAIAIKISSPGPVFFRQKRTGYLGREFTCWKFRTMRVNSEADKIQASKDDPRKTVVGDFLRRTSIDELPQFLNVFLGDMSVVGPRPHMLAHTEQYSKLVDKYMVRHMVKPGITGWAQVNGYRGQTNKLWQMEKRVEFDVWYIENWSMMLDIKIVFRTIFNALHGEDNAF